MLDHHQQSPEDFAARLQNLFSHSRLVINREITKLKRSIAIVRIRARRSAIANGVHKRSLARYFKSQRKVERAMRMFKKYLLLSGVLFFWSTSTLGGEADEIVTDHVVTRIAFGSCNSQDKPQPLWASIQQENPDLWIWTGDNVYADTEDPEVFRDTYERQLANADYAKFVNSIPFLTGIWDDHDYGVNDGGAEYPQKHLAKQEMYRFLNVPKNDPSRFRAGAYRSYDYGPPEKRVRVILLDTRWFRDSLERTQGRESTYIANLDGTILGADQWRWLEQQLSDPEPDVTVLVSSIQVVASEHRFEKWANFPNQQSRLYSLLAKTKPSNLFVISGDRHAAEISEQQIAGWGKTLVDITSSGLTNTWSREFPEVNSRAIGPKVIAKNYGLIQIDWTNAEQPLVTVSIRGVDKKEYQTISF